MGKGRILVFQYERNSGTWAKVVRRLRSVRLVTIRKRYSEFLAAAQEENARVVILPAYYDWTGTWTVRLANTLAKHADVQLVVIPILQKSKFGLHSLNLICVSRGRMQVESLDESWLDDLFRKILNQAKGWKKIIDKKLETERGSPLQK